MLNDNKPILAPLITGLEELPLELITYKIRPDYTIDNSNNDSLIHVLSAMYKSPRERLKIRELKYYAQQKVYFDIIFRHNRVNFYCSIPRDYSDLVVGKMKTIWNKSEISRTEICNINSFNKKKTCLCEMILKDFNFKSLSTAKNNLYPLTNMMGIIKLLKEGEQVRINIAIEPINRQNWYAVAKDEFKSYKEGRQVNNEIGIKEKAIKTGFKGAELGLELYLEFKMLLFESIMGIVMPEKKEEMQKIEIKLDSIEAIKKQNEMNSLTSSTTYKMTAETFKTRITIMSESNDLSRANMNMLSVANNYKDLNGDNELIIKTLTRSEQERLFDSIINFNVMTRNKCVMSDKELAKLIQLPQKDLQNEYKIESIDTREVSIPPQLQNGNIRIGIANKQGRDITATWSMDKNIMALAKVFVGCQNAGKTTAIKRTVKECYKAGYSNVVIDYIENCDTAREIAETIPREDKIILDLSNKKYIPAMAYNEVSKLITEDMDPWDRVEMANLISEQVEYLINAVTDTSTGELTAPMLRYLHAASMVTFIKPGAKINDVFIVLRRWDKRNEAIRYAKYSNCFEKDDDIFFDLEELHDRDKEGKIIGTREHLISGILNRIIILQKNPYIKAMLTSDINTSEDFAKHIEDGKSIFILIPQTKFPNPIIRDILTTFFISRLWLTVQLRTNNKKARLCNIVFDEVHQVPTTARFLSNHITEFRRHRLGLILSCHFLKQLKDLLNSLKSSGASYIFIAGTEKENLEYMKQELEPFTVDDGLKLKPFTSLNVVNYGNQYAKFITKLPRK